MKGRDRFERYLDHLSGSLGHADRVAGLKGYCAGLMLPLERKSVEPMVAGIDPRHASARHQALHHFVEGRLVGGVVTAGGGCVGGAEDEPRRGRVGHG